MPATGSSTNKSKGSWTSNIPSSNHCFCPCESSPARTRTCSVNPIVVKRLVNATPLFSGQARHQTVPETLVRSHSQFKILEDRVPLKHRRALKLASDAGQGDLILRHLGEIQGIAEKDRALVRAGFAGDHIHQGGLPRPIGTDQTAQFARIKIERQVIQRLKAVKTDGEIFNVQNDAM